MIEQVVHRARYSACLDTISRRNSFRCRRYPGDVWEIDSVLWRSGNWYQEDVDGAVYVDGSTSNGVPDNHRQRDVGANRLVPEEVARKLDGARFAPINVAPRQYCTETQYENSARTARPRCMKDVPDYERESSQTNKDDVNVLTDRCAIVQ